jgi:hypothetical protein
MNLYDLGKYPIDGCWKRFDERREHRLTRCRRDGLEVTSSALNKMREDLNPVATVVPKNQEEGSTSTGMT